MFVHTDDAPETIPMVLSCWWHGVLYLINVNFVHFYLNNLKLQTGTLVSFMNVWTVSEFLNVVITKIATLSENIYYNSLCLLF